MRRYYLFTIFYIVSSELCKLYIPSYIRTDCNSAQNGDANQRSVYSANMRRYNNVFTPIIMTIVRPISILSHKLHMSQYGVLAGIYTVVDVITLISARF